MLAVFESIDPLSRRTNLPRRRSFIKIHSSFLNALKTKGPWTSFGRTIVAIGKIEKAVMIVTLVSPDPSAPPQPLRSIWSLFLPKTTVTGYWSGKTRTWVKLHVTILTISGILLTNALSFISQKGDIGLGNLHVND